MKNALLILLLLTPALFADKKPKRNVAVKDSSPTGIKTDVGGHLLVESSGIVTLTKQGQRASYNVVGASEKGTLLLGLDILGLDTKADEGAFKVQLAKGAKIKFIEPQDQKEREARWKETTRNAVARIFETHDANNDDVIDAYELKKAGTIGLFIKLEDTNKDGSVSKEELISDLSKYQMPVNGHSMVLSAIKTDLNGHLQVENTGIVRVWADSWPPLNTENDNKANVLIVRTLNSGISSGKIKLKKPR